MSRYETNENSFLFFPKLRVRIDLPFQSPFPFSVPFDLDFVVSTNDLLLDICRNVDKNSNGAIDFNEFIEMMLRRDSKVEEDVVHAFREEQI